MASFLQRVIMYKILTIKDKVKVPPSRFNLALKEAVKSSLEDRWEGLIDKVLGVTLSVMDIGQVGEGRILPGDGSIHYPVEFKLLVYYPEMHEVVIGNVIDVTEFGVFIRMGPLDGMIHVSQIMDDFVSYDPKNMIFSGKESKRVIKEGDDTRARVISISMGRQYKIGLTTRQPNMGVLEWFEREKRQAAAEKAPDKKAAQEKGGKGARK
jgi:DNA-directed RNA polymerase subunit E'